MKYISIILFVAAAVCMAYGVHMNITENNGNIAGVGTMATNTYYQLSLTISGLAIAAELILSRRSA